MLITVLSVLNLLLVIKVLHAYKVKMLEICKNYTENSSSPTSCSVLPVNSLSINFHVSEEHAYIAASWLFYFKLHWLLSIMQDGNLALPSFSESTPHIGF